MTEKRGLRVLVTGSRDWYDRERIVTALAHVVMYDWDVLDPEPTLVVGDCPTGADRIATEYWNSADSLMLPIEVYEADWQTHGRRAGYLRNQAMVDSGVDLCLAFIKDGSRGATMTADLAEKAGIPVKRFIINSKVVES